ncbi:4-phosphopantetheinyl transferase, partial [Nostoc linckia z16]
MPLFKFQLINSDTHLLVWKITETLQELLQQVTLKDVCTTRLNGMKSEQHQKGFLSVRMLLQAAGYTDFDMYYGEDGKPHLTDGKNISVSHSHNFSSLIISKRNVGIDLEMQRQKIISIAEKFAINEMEYLNAADEP